MLLCEGYNALRLAIQLVLVAVPESSSSPCTKCVRPPRFYHVGPYVVYPGPRQQPILRHRLGLNVPQVFYSIISTYASRAAASSNLSRCFLERVNSRVLLVSDGRSL